MFRINKLKYRSLAALAIFAAIGFPVAAATTGTLGLTGTAPGVLEIAVTSKPAATTLALATDVTDLAVASVLEKSNKKTGYTVVLSSLNAGTGTQASLDSSETLEKLPYTLKYDSSSVSLSGGSATITSSATKTPKAGTAKELTISFAGFDANLAQGTYSDTLTFTISAP